MNFYVNVIFVLLCCSSNLSNGTVMTVSPAKPSYLQYRIPQDAWSVVVRAQSADDLCGVMSVQDDMVFLYISLLQCWSPKAPYVCCI